MTEKQTGEVIPLVKTASQISNALSMPDLKNTTELRDYVVKVGTMMERAQAGDGYTFGTPKGLLKEAAASIPAIKELLRPATGAEMAKALDELFTFSGLLGKRPADLETATLVFTRALGDIPGDLVLLAVHRVEKTHAFKDRKSVV